MKLQYEETPAPKFPSKSLMMVLVGFGFGCAFCLSAQQAILSFMYPGFPQYAYFGSVVILLLSLGLCFIVLKAYD